MDFSFSWSLLAFAAAVCVAATTGGAFRPGQWYRDLSKPSWNPPDFLFPIAWTLLYALMAWAAWLVWERVGWPQAAVPIGLWVAQLVFNALWSVLFFGLRRMDWALVDVAVLWSLIVATMIAFWQAEALAGWLMVPYLAWVSFAAFLNFTLIKRNPDARAKT